MEEELQCPVCQQLFEDPVILSCSHNLCYKCAETLILKSGNTLNEIQPSFALVNGVRKYLEADKASLISEAVLSDSDSGYFGATGNVATNRSDGNGSPVTSSVTSNTTSTFLPLNGGFATPPNGPTLKCINLPVLPDSVKYLTCPICHRTIFLDERGADGLTKHTLMKNIVDRYSKSNANKLSTMTTQSQKSDGAPFTDRQSLSAIYPTNSDQSTPLLTGGLDELCQLCCKTPADTATVKCMQCDVSYCESCREKCHPFRGPLAKHNIINLKKPKILSQNSADKEKPNVYRHNKFPPLPSKLSTKNGLKLSSCVQHSTEKNSLYCEICRASLCVLCQDEGKHKGHVVKPIGALFKQQKSDLSVQMSGLSNKARQAKDLVVLLRGTQNKIEKNSLDLEAKTIAQCNQLIEIVERKRDDLIQKVLREKDGKCKVAREQLQQCTMKLKQTTGLLEYCIEVVKDNDVTAFLQISQSLTERVSSMEKQWNQRSLQPRVDCEFDLELNSEPLVHLLDQVDFVRTKVPNKPSIRVENGGGNNTVTLSWAVPSTSQPADGFRLEMDNGCNGPFKEVYYGSETLCTIEGLHLNSVYKARVRAFNKSGCSPFSETLQLQTSEATNFQMDNQLSHSDIVISPDNVISCKNKEHKTVIGKTGFTLGIHYWEYEINRCEKRPGPAFGVALQDTDTSRMLGNDARGWSLYGPDEETSWLLHNEHFMHKYDTPLTVGSRIGLSLDLHKKCLSFFVDGKLLTTTMLCDPSLSTVQATKYYPAASVNNSSQITLHTGMRAPLSGISNHLNQSRGSLNGELKTGSFSNFEMNKPRTPTPVLKSFSSFIEGRSPKGIPPPPPIRRSSSGNLSSAKSEGDIGSTTGSDQTPVRNTMSGVDRASRHSFTSLFQKKNVATTNP